MVRNPLLGYDTKTLIRYSLHTATGQPQGLSTPSDTAFNKVYSANYWFIDPANRNVEGYTTGPFLSGWLLRSGHLYLYMVPMYMQCSCRAVDGASEAQTYRSTWLQRTPFRSVISVGA